MKKVFIVSACALTLCFASCATNEAPAEEAQIETPQIEETSEDETTAESEADTAEEADLAAENENEQTELFPEPEAFEEPEIITLEPADDPLPQEQAPLVEEVEKEEPPAITEAPAETEAEADLTAEAEPDAEATLEAESEASTETEENTPAADSDAIIDITDDDSDSGEEYSENEKEIIPSRSVTMKKFEYLDVTYPGSGWIFMGLTDNSKDIAYFGRKLGTKDTKFTLQARNAGTKIVHFYKNDPLSGNYLDDYLKITVLAENGSNKTHIQAPEYKLPVQKKEVKKAQPVEQEEEAPQPAQTSQAAQTTQPAQAAQPAKAAQQTQPVQKTQQTQTSQPAKNVQTTKTERAEPAPEVVKTEPAAAESKDYSVLLKEAQLLYNEQAYSEALAKINQFFEFAADKRDEGLYLKGQILEAKSNVRDIKGAIEAYSSLTKNYPASKLWDSANKRIIYLKRFYLEVR